MRRAALALTIAVSGTGCSERSVAPAQAPIIPLDDVLSEIKQEVAEYNRGGTNPAELQWPSGHLNAPYWCEGRGAV